MMLKTFFAAATVVVAASAQAPASPAPASNGSAPMTPQAQGQTGNTSAAAPAAGGAAASAPVPSGLASGSPANNDANAVVSASQAQSNPPGADSITAHGDPQCQNPLANATKNQFDVTQSFPKYNRFPYQPFHGAENPNGGGFNVWWSTPPNSDPTCRYIIMLPYNGFQKPYDGAPPGYEIINVAQQGCYFSNIPVDREVYMTKCCGDACGSINLGQATSIAPPSFNNPAVNPSQGVGAAPAQGNAAPATSVDADDMSPLPAQEPTAATKRAVQAFVKRNEVPQSGSPAAKANALMSRFWYDLPAEAAQKVCTSTNGAAPGTPYLSAGKQIIVSQAESCQSGVCSVSVTYTNNYATTITSSHEESFSNGVEASIAVEAGADFIGEAKVTTTLGYSWSKAVTDATGKDIQAGTSVATAYNIQFQVGQRSVLTFTPHLQCWTSPIACPDDSNQHGPADYCQPITMGTGDQTMPVGDYSVLVLDY